MQFHEDHGSGANRIEGYGAGYFVVNDERYETSVAMAAQGECVSLGANAVGALTAADLDTVLANKPDVILLGTGARHHFAPPALTAAAAAAGAALEAMNSGAACRTYNVLAAEGRAVAALLIRIECEGA